MTLVIFVFVISTCTVLCNQLMMRQLLKAPCSSDYARHAVLQWQLWPYIIAAGTNIEHIAGQRHTAAVCSCI
jgi:hypothetical protein